jgi:MFS family permease
MRRFATATSVGVWQTFIVFGAIYFTAMIAGAFGYRLPPPGWTPAGWTPSRAQSSTRAVAVDVAWRTPQFWLLWAVLCLNVSAGIGIVGMASPMIQEVFKGRVSASAAAGFTGLLSLFNIAGRIFWASLSDRIGRRATYAIFFGLGVALYAFVPTASRSGSLALFVATFCIILTMYGGGFATIPAYLADLFGVQYVSAIHGRLLTAWSTAGILGPVLVNYIREFQLSRGVAPSDAYIVTMYVLAALLAIGFVCNLAVRPVPERLFVEFAGAERGDRASVNSAAEVGRAASRQWVLAATAWTLAAIPIGWGVLRTFTLARQMFR